MNWKLLISLVLFVFSSNSYALYCGEWVTEDITLTEDLDCSGHAGYALVVKNEEVTINGNGFSIIAPDAIAGIYAEGSSLTINNLQILGSSSNIAIQSYNNYYLETDGLIANNFRLGIDNVFDSYGDVALCNGLNIQNSFIEGSEDFGIRVTAPNCLANVTITNTSLENSKNYAANINVDTFVLNSLNGSSVHNSYGGFLVYAREVELMNVDFSEQDVENETMLIIGSQKVSVSDSNFSGPDGSTGIGMHICEVDEVYIDNIISNGHDVGVKISTGSKQTTVTLNNSEFVENTTAGILLSELAGVPFANFYADGNSIGGNGNADILVTTEILDEVVTNTTDPTIPLDRVICEIEISDSIDKEKLALDDLLNVDKWKKSLKSKFAHFYKKIRKYRKYKKHNKNKKHHYVRKLASIFKKKKEVDVLEEQMTLSLPSSYLDAYYSAVETGDFQNNEDLQYGLSAAFLNEVALSLESLVEKNQIDEYDERYEDFLVDLNALDSEELKSLVDSNFSEMTEFFTAKDAHHHKHYKHHKHSRHPNKSQGCKNGKGHHKKYGRGHKSHGKGYGFGHCHDSQEPPAIKVLGCQVVEL